MKKIQKTDDPFDLQHFVGARERVYGKMASPGAFK